MSVKKGQQIELEITDLAFGGQGIARANGFTIFVNQTAPQDRVIARIYKKKKNYAEARVVELLSPSSLRVDASCPYSGVCGGCKWQFLAYEHQLLYKQQHVRDALEHIALINDVTVHATIPSDRVLGYRNKMEFSCANYRWLLPQQLGRDNIDASMALGLHVPGTYYKVLDIQACLLQPDMGNQILETVRQYIKASPQPIYGLRSHTGFWRFLVLRHSTAYDQWMVNVVTAAEDRFQVQPLADMLIAEFPNVVSVVNNITARKAGVAIGEYEVPLAGQSYIQERIHAYEFELSANSFFQTNTLGARRLYNMVKQYAELNGTQNVLDLYCGTGTISLFLASQAKQVTGMEVAASAIADAQRNCQRNHIDNCRFIEGDIRYQLPQHNVRPDVMIIDPPRAGMHQDVVKAVLAIGPQKIVYVSCNPATMARDILLLKQDYTLIQVQPVDMFPHTYHIESVAQLHRK